jgi:adenosylhomocysteinase
MPVLHSLAARFTARPPLVGRRVAALVNVTHEATTFVAALCAAGAQVVVVSSKDTTYDAGAAARMAADGARVWREPLHAGGTSAAGIVGFAPEFAVDNGDLAGLWQRRPGAPPVHGATIHSQNALKRVSGSADPLPFPVFSVAESPLKTMVETAHGTGQAAARGLMDNGVQLAGKRVLILGYGVTGRAVADYVRGCHARVAVTEVAPVPALQAVFNGYELVDLETGLASADVVLTITDAEHALTLDHLGRLRDGCVVGGIGHATTEIDRDGLARKADAVRRAPGQVRYRIDGRWLTVLEGPGGNHVFAGINPPEMIDISFALHALCLVWLAQDVSMPKRLQPVPAEVEAEVARIKLGALGLSGGQW